MLLNQVLISTDLLEKQVDREIENNAIGTNDYIENSNAKMIYY